MCTYIDIYIYKYTCMHRHVYEFFYLYEHIYAHTKIHFHINICTLISTYLCINIYSSDMDEFKDFSTSLSRKKILEDIISLSVQETQVPTSIVWISYQCF
jgi:hypothetical protein